MVSPTYIAAGVSLFVFIAGLFNVKLNQENTMTLATELVGIATSIIVLYRRYKHGGITLFGSIKK